MPNENEAPRTTGPWEVIDGFDMVVRTTPDEPSARRIAHQLNLAACRYCYAAQPAGGWKDNAEQA